MPPRVTAVLPCHNHAPWVADAVRSVDAQDYPHRAAVLIDDGSTDDPLAAVRPLLADAAEGVGPGGTPYVRGTLPNGTPLAVARYAAAAGPAAARNRGAALAAALFPADALAFLDTDDVYHPAKLARSVPRLADPAVAVVYSDYDTLRPDGGRVREFKPPYSRRLLLRDCVINCDSVVRRSAFDAAGGFDEALRVCEDYDLWLRLTEAGSAAHIPEALVTVRVGAHSSTATVRSETWRACYRRVFDKLRARSGG